MVMRMNYSINFHDMYHVIAIVIKVIIKSFFVCNFPLLPNIPCSNDNELELIL